jgi:hypothetical protein
MSRFCPVTHATCHNPKCWININQQGYCDFEERPSEKLWDKLMKEFEGIPYHFGPDKDKVIANLSSAIERLTRHETEEHHHRKHREKPIFALTTFINNQTLIYMADIKIIAGTPVTGIFTLLDNKTLQPLTGVSFTNKAIGFNTNPEIATFSIDENGNLAGTNVATSGSGKVTVTADAAYTDPGDNSAQTGSFTVTKNFAVVASPDGVTFDIIIS